MRCEPGEKQEENRLFFSSLLGEAYFKTKGEFTYDQNDNQKCRRNDPK